MDYDYAILLYRIYLTSEVCFVLNVSLPLSVQSCFCYASVGFCGKRGKCDGNRKK